MPCPTSSSSPRLAESSAAANPPIFAAPPAHALTGVLVPLLPFRTGFPTKPGLLTFIPGFCAAGKLGNMFAAGGLVLAGRDGAGDGLAFVLDADAAGVVHAAVVTLPGPARCAGVARLGKKLPLRLAAPPPPPPLAAAHVDGFAAALRLLCVVLLFSFKIRFPPLPAPLLPPAGRPFGPGRLG